MNFSSNLTVDASPQCIEIFLLRKTEICYQNTYIDGHLPSSTVVEVAPVVQVPSKITKKQIFLDRVVKSVENWAD